MSEYSGYQRQRAHALGAFASVYEATAPDGRPGRFALKIFHPPPSTNIRRAYAIEGWLLAAERQQKSAKKDGAVLEILAFGRCAEGAYSVTPWQERPLEPVVETLAAKGDLLRALAECLLNTIEQWGTQTGGSHRKLKAANVFLTRSGPLAGMTAVLSDPWFMYGKTSTPRVNDLTAVGAILAQVVRRRQAAAWPIEDAPEWKALGRPGKAWLAYANYLLNPQPAAGELTMAEARRRLRAIPKDARPMRTAILIGTAAVFLLAGGILGFARFGNPIYMPLNLRKLAETVKNPRAVTKDVTPAWSLLCRAWDTWLGDVQANAPRLLRTQGLWSGPNDPLRAALVDFSTNANSLLPGTVVPEAAGEKRLTALGDSPSDAVEKELKTTRVRDDVEAAYEKVLTLAGKLENWPRWDELRKLLVLLEGREFNRAAAALQPRLPPVVGGGVKLDTARTLKLFNDVSLDETGTLLLARDWSKLSDVKIHMESTYLDRVQVRMPELILARLSDRSSIGEFADSLAEPLAELTRLREKYYPQPTLVAERFLAESKLLKETAEVTVVDFPRWEQELELFKKVPAADDPRLRETVNDAVRRLPSNAEDDLEPEAPAQLDPAGPATLSKVDYRTALQQRRTELNTLRSREIVRIDLPTVAEETTQLIDRFQELEKRLEATLAMLKPEIWLGKLPQTYGKFNETKQRWAAWRQAALTGVTPEVLTLNKPRFRQLRADERKLREWLDGLEGPEGFGALAVPDISAASADTATALRQLEMARREQAATAVAAAAGWTNALPTATWVAASAAVRAPLEAHRQWLAELPAFSVDLDRLRALLADGFGWDEGISEVVDRLAKYAGLDALAGPPAGWNNEAKLLGQLVGSNDRAALTAAAQSGGLSRNLTAWRRLGTLTGWPAGADDLDVDGGVVTRLRESVGRDVKDESRRGTLLAELTRETRVRWNRAARNSAANEAQVTAVYERMDRYGIGEADLGAEALFNFKLWHLKRADWTIVDIGPLRTRRDAFLEAVRAIAGVANQPVVANFVQQLTGITFPVADPNRKPTPSPRVAGWSEELTDDGLGLSATWRGGGKTVKLDYHIVQPTDELLPFYLAKRAIAVGDFLDLMAARRKEETAAVLEALPNWTRSETDIPFNQPMAWLPRFDNRGNFSDLMLSSTWIARPTALVKGLLDNTELHATVRALEQAVAEKPTLRSPLQQVPPTAAKIFAEKLLGARLPTPAEWQAALKEAGAAPNGYFRGAAFQNLYNYLRDYNVEGVVITWRPNDGVFQPMVAGAGGKPVKFKDDGQAGAGAGGTRVWFAPVDEAPAAGKFVNLTGNLSIFLSDNAPTRPQYFVAGGSALSPPGIDFRQERKVEVGGGEIGATASSVPYADVGIRPAFDAPPGFRERYKLLLLVRQQKFLTW